MSSLVPLDEALGTLLAGTWASVCVWTIEVVQIWRYFSLFPEDGWGLKSVILVSFSSDTASTILSCIMVYLYNITHWGDVIYLLHQPVYFPLMILTIIISGAASQIFLQVRIIKLAKSKLFKWAVGLGFAGFQVALMALGLRIVYILLTYREFQDRGLVYIPLIIWLSLSATADVSLTILLVLLLVNLRAKTHLSKTSFMGPVIKQLLLRTVETGALTAALVLLVLLLLIFADKESNAETAVSMSIGKIYTVTIVTNLLSRKDNATKRVVVSDLPDLSIAVPAPTKLLSSAAAEARGGTNSSQSFQWQYSADIELNSVDKAPELHWEFDMSMRQENEV
ncbi:hypothetical protein T439DRAFT_351088 [Meredithblackwellia eburnea MCA 4105]